ncbi:hypothetical protein [Treponema sp.]|uniref:hypothetical protein n=1 Tax=Treponema sp. TaxID=166 RepID=UPI00298D7F6F|nr:hypothetical protein [Treponema sp.]
MIKIKISSAKKLEKIHWAWFSARMDEIAWPNNKSHKDFIFEKIKFLEKNEEGYDEITQNKLKLKRLQTLIIGDPNTEINGEKIYDFFKKINKKYKWHNISAMSKKENETDSEFTDRKKICEKDNKLTQDLQEAFGYNDFVASPSKAQWYIDFKKKNNNKDWNIKVLNEKLNVDVCPYCNRQYIFGYDLANKKRNIAEIDHFNPKSHYPFLSCSLYNFIPSCHTCNSIKQAQDKNILYPYTDSLDEYTKKEKNAVFTFKAKNGSQLTFPINKKTQKKIELKINPNYSKKNEADESKKLFHLDEIYSKHILELNDIIERYENCTPKQLQALYNFVTTNLQINISEENLKKLILGLPINTTKEYPLRKFKEDIIDYLSKIDQNMAK